MDHSPQRFHFLGICGKAMAGIAADLKRSGHEVTGSDDKVYPPMSDFLRERGILFFTPYCASNVPDALDCVIVGKRVSAENAELLHVLRRGLPHQSFPQFLRERFLVRSRNAVVAGGVGKTTGTAMLSWIMEHAGLQPDYLIGGLARNLPEPVRFSGSRFAVLEGDEYAACFNDARPKFLHYEPEMAIITNLAEDHPDLYHGLENLSDAFGSLIEILPANGRLIMPADDAVMAKLAQAARCGVDTVGLGSGASQRITSLRTSAEGSRFSLAGQRFQIRPCGMMNVRNAAMAVLAAAHFGVEPARSSDALSLFSGVRYRQEEKNWGGITLLRDKATHPYAIRELSQALRQRFPRRRLVSLIQPRATGGRDWIYQRDLPEALSHFDEVILTNSYEHDPQQPTPWASSPFSLEMVYSSLRKRMNDVTMATSASEMIETLTGRIREGDVVVVTVLEQAGFLADAVEDCLKQRYIRGAGETCKRASANAA